MKRKPLVILLVMLLFLGLFREIAAEEDGVRILERVSQSVARIVNDDGMGTGFFITNRHIVTNHHVVSTYLQDGYVGGKGWFTSAKGDTVRVYYSEANRDYVTGTVVQDWPEVDLAVVELSSPSTKRIPLELTPLGDIKAGMTVFVVGFPGVDVLTRNLEERDIASIADGRLKKVFTDQIAVTSAKYQAQSYSAMVNPGNSGGPVVDINGNVIGIANSSLRTDAETAYYGIHVSELISRLDQAGISYTVVSKTVPTNTPVPTATPRPATATPRPTLLPTTGPTVQSATPTAQSAAPNEPSAAPTRTPRTRTATPEPSEDDGGFFSDWDTTKTLIVVLAAAVLIFAVILINKSGSRKEEPRSAGLSTQRPVSVPTQAYQEPVRPSPAPPILPEVTSNDYIHGIAGQLKGMRKNLSTTEDLVFGKDPSVCNVLLDSRAQQVSRRHCRIHYSKRNQCYVVQDLGSRNGTYVFRGNERRQVSTETALRLHDRDQIFLADAENVFSVHLSM